MPPPPKLPRIVPTKSAQEERTVASVAGSTLPWDPLWQYVLGDNTDDEDGSSCDDSYDDRYGLNDKSFDDTIQGHSFDVGNESSFDTYDDTDDDEEASVVQKYFKKNNSNNPNDEMRQLLANKRYEEILDALRLYDQVKEERELRTEALFGNNSNNNQRIAALLGRGRNLSFQRRSNNNNNSSVNKGQQPIQLQPSSSSRSFGKSQSAKQQQQTRSSSSSSLPIDPVADLERQHSITQRIPSSLKKKPQQQDAIDNRSTASATTNPISNKEISRKKESVITKASAVPILSSSSSSVSPTIASKPSSLSSISELVRTMSLVPQQQQHPRNAMTKPTGNNLNKNINKDTSNKNIALSKSTSSSTNNKNGTTVPLIPTSSSISSSTTTLTYSRNNNNNYTTTTKSSNESGGGFLRRNSSNSTCKTKRDEIVNNNNNNNNMSLREEKEEKDSHPWVTGGWQLDPDIFPSSLSVNLNGNQDDTRDDYDNQGISKRNMIQQRKGNKSKKNILRKLMCYSNHNKNNDDYDGNHNAHRLHYDEQSTNKNSVSTHAISEHTNDPW